MKYHNYDDFLFNWPHRNILKRGIYWSHLITKGGDICPGIICLGDNCSRYRVTQNKVHHLLAILYLIFEVNITPVSYAPKSIISNEVQFNKVKFWKRLSTKNISNCAAIWQNIIFEISFCFWYLKDVRAVLCLKIALNEKKTWNLTKPSQIAQLLRYLRWF